MAPIAVTFSSAPVVVAKQNGADTMNGTTAAPAAASSSFGPNTSAVLHGAKDLRIEKRQYAAPTGDEVQIRVRATGLCGSDLHYYLHGCNGDFALQHSMCLGHESAGEIVALGPNVPASLSLNVGDRVAIEAGRFCGSCPKCRDGRYNLCKQMRFASSAKTYPHLDGTLQNVVLQGIRRSALQPGQSVLVYGAGAVGLLACAAAKASGASFVAAVDIDEGRLGFAAANGWADATYLLPRGAPVTVPEVEGQDALAKRAAEDKAAISSASTAATALLAALQKGPASSSNTGFATGIFATKPGGKMVLIGMGNPIQTLPIGSASLREVDIVGVFRYANTYPIALGLLAGGTLRAQGGGLHAQAKESQKQDEGEGAGKKMGGIENLVSHAYPLKDAVKAFETLANGKDAEHGRGVVKVFITDDEP
ncbi:hypothetical protein NDA12_007048 [Ustilago hordei]|nr:hypothetical protein NDA12_007048 [Ustilago hordei]